jgi:flagellar assembly protein FliH
MLDRAAIDAKISELVGRYMASRNQAGLPGHEVTP